MNLGWSKKTGDSGILAGAIQYFATADAPKGWLKADGSAVLRTQYEKLFLAIGTTFGSGDGSTTFNLPDLRGEFVRGFDDGRGVDSGRTIGSKQSDNTKAHYHAVLSYPFRSNTPLYTIPAEQNTMNVYTGSANGTTVHTGNQCTVELGTTMVGGTETCPRNIALLACIKY
jgi:microcystin-dependent protein